MADQFDDDNSPPAAPVAPAAPPKKQRGVAAAPALAPVRQGAGGALPAFLRESNDADSTWDQMVPWLMTYGYHPRDVYLSVKRVDPPVAGGQPVPIGRIAGAAVQGGNNIGPGANLIEYMERWIHIPTSPQQGSAKYEIEFHFGPTGRTITTAYMTLADVPTIMAAMTARDQFAREGAGGGLGMAPSGGFGRGDMGQAQGVQPPIPPMQVGGAVYAPPYGMMGYAMPPGFQPTPPAPQPQAPTIPPEFMSMFGSVMGELMAAAREGRKPAMPPVSVAAPVLSEEEKEDRIVAKTVMALQRLGAIPQSAPPVQVATPPVAAPPSGATMQVTTLAGMVEKMVGGMLEKAVQAVGSSMEASIKHGLGVGAPPAAEEGDTTDQAIAPTNPEDHLPFQLAPTGAQWPDGRPVHYAKDKESGDLSPVGLMMGNPYVAERAMTLVEGLGGAIKTAVEKFASNQMPAAGVGRPAPQLHGGTPSAPTGAPVETNGMAAPPSPPASPGTGWEQP